MQGKLHLHHLLAGRRIKQTWVSGFYCLAVIVVRVVLCKPSCLFTEQGSSRVLHEAITGALLRALIT